MDIEQIKLVSFRGRVAYGISCFENILMVLKYNPNDWRGDWSTYGDLLVHNI